MANQVKLDPKKNAALYSYGSNFLNSRQIHRERRIYDNVIFPDNLIKNSMDTWGEDRFYGICNTKGNTTFVDQDYLKPLYFTQDNITQFTLDFVSDAWYDFCTRMRDLLAQNVIFQNSPWSDPRVVKAWSSPETSYREYMNNDVYRSFVGNFLPVGNKDRDIKDISSFFDVFDHYLDTVVSLIGPMTFSGYLESNSMSPLTTGLMIEIAEENYDDDFVKSYAFLDENFELVSNIAGQYGFSIDKNVPWRLIADLNSPVMKEYMCGVEIESFEENYPDALPCDPTLLPKELAPMAFGYSSVPGMENVKRRVAVHYDEDGNPVPGYQAYQSAKDATAPEQVFEVLFSTAYFETWQLDVEILEELLLSFYNSYVELAPITTYEEEVGTLSCPPKQVVITREMVSEEEFAASFGERWKLKTFYVLRTTERHPDKSFKMKRTDIQRIMNVYNLSQRSAYDRSLRFAQEEFIGPYDTDPLTLDTVGDIIRSGEDDDLSDSRRQNRVRGNLYT